MTFAPPKKPYQYPDRPIYCQVSMDDAFRECGKIAAAGCGPEETAAAIYELTDNHLTALRENYVLDRQLAVKGEN